MADSDSDLETDSFQSALDALFVRHCGDQSSPNSKDYCSDFCTLVEEHTGRWQVPLPQLKVLQTALRCFTRATAAFPDDCQHVRYALSSLALSYFELMLFFSKEEFVEDPMKNILDSFQECHLQLMRHRNVYLVQVRQSIKAGGPWESPVLQSIMRDTSLTRTEVDEFLRSEVPVFLELRVRYLQACERVQEAMALTKACLEHSETGKHHYFHQAYLTCLYRASLHEHAHKEMAELDGRDAVEIICNTESVEKSEVLLSLCKAFLTQQLHNGDMYYIWDLVFIWSRLHLRAHPSRQGFLEECLLMASSASNVRAVFPFIKVLTAELGNEGVRFSVELCGRALQQLCDPRRADPVTFSLVCKTIAFLLPSDLEVCRACALRVFCLERSLEAYRSVCRLYTHPDEELHPCSSPVPTNVRFHMLQILKEGLCFDPEFWNLLTLRTHCLELFSDAALKAAVLSEMEMEAEKEKEYQQVLTADQLCPLHSTHATNSLHRQSSSAPEPAPPEERWKGGQLSDSGAAGVKRRKWKRRRRQKRILHPSDDEADFGDDPEIKFYGPSFAANDSQYSLRRKYARIEISAAPPGKFPANRQREYLSRCVKNNILKRKGRKKRWLQGLLPLSEPPQGRSETKGRVKGKVKGKVKVKGKKRKTSQRLELSYPDNEVTLEEEEEDRGIMDDTEERGGGQDDESQKENELALGDVAHEKIQELEEKRENTGNDVADVVDEGVPGGREVDQPVVHTEVNLKCCEGHPPGGELPEGGPELGEPAFEPIGCPVELFHNYSLHSKHTDDGTPQPPPATAEAHTHNGDPQPEEKPLVETITASHPQVKVKKTWKEKILQTQRYGHLRHHCSLCQKDFKGLNVMRHALSHLKKNKLQCILCGKWFRTLPFAEKHIMDHIDTMCKEKPSSKDKSGKKNKKGKPGKKGKGKPGGEDLEVAAVNGAEAVSENVNRDGGENGPSSPSRPQKSKKNNVVKAKPSLSRESRIIRNLRLNLKKNHKNGNGAELEDFTDEQVVFKEDVVMVRRAASVTEQPGEEEVKERPAGGNGYGGFCTTYYLCPSELCDKVFSKVGPALRHALKCHANEDRVLKKTFEWSKCRCLTCQRLMQFFQQYKDHMKLHDGPLRHFCYHVECNMRFLTSQELKDHIEIHEPFRPQCSYAGCQQQFSFIQSLYDHEWRHYIPAPQREEMEKKGPNRHKTQSAEAPWKQRVKIEEIWMQGGKGQKDRSREIHGSEMLTETDESEPPAQGATASDPAGGDQGVLNLPTSPETVDISKTSDTEATVLNGHVKGEGDHQTTETEVVQAAPKQKNPPESVLDIKLSDPESVTVIDGLEALRRKKLTAFKPEDPVNTLFVKTPLVRPPPSSYMNEKELSMRKRRTVEEDPPKNNYRYWGYKKVEVKKLKEEAPEVKTRSRCNKCLSFFNSLEEMKKHQDLNSCSALFGFDSDDES